MPFAEGIRFEARGNALVALCAPTEGGPRLDPPALARLIEAQGYGDWARLPEGLDALVQRWNEGGEAFEQTVACSEDARLTVEVDPDGLTAWLKLQAARGGKAPEADDVAHLLVQAGVV